MYEDLNTLPDSCFSIQDKSFNRAQIVYDLMEPDIAPYDIEEFTDEEPEEDNYFDGENITDDEQFI